MSPQEFIKDSSYLETICCDGGYGDVFLTLGLIGLLVVSLILLIRRRIKLSSFWILLAIATALSFWWREFQLIQIYATAHSNAGINPWDLAFDHHFVHRRTSVRFALIAFCLLAGAALHFHRGQRVKDSSQKAGEA